MERKGIEGESIHTKMIKEKALSQRESKSKEGQVLIYHFLCRYLLSILFKSVSALLSNLVSNVPAVMLLKPLTTSMAQQVRRRAEIGFMEYFRVGGLITVSTIIIGILVLALPVGAANGAEHISAPQRDKHLTVTVIPSSNPGSIQRTFRVVLLCDNDEEMTRGLQGFRPLKHDEAALFVFEKPAQSTFWMGSVTFPIDIIFVGPEGRVVRMYPNRRPGSLDVYPSDMPVKWVIETAAGSGIRVGDRVRIK